MPVTTHCGVFAFLMRAMGCFLDCFRVRHDSRHPRPRLVPDSSPSAAREEERQKMRLSSLFASQEREECVVKDRESLVRRLGRSEIDEGLLEEAKLLKACGTLSQTPAEIRKAVTFSEKLENSDTQRPHRALKFSPETPVAIQQAETFPENLESSDSQISQSLLETSPVTPEEIQNVETCAEEKAEVKRPRTVIKSSPYPTPRKITDDMQTPGTVFATNMKSLSKGNARIRSQYVYTVSNPTANHCELEGLEEEHSVLNGASEHGGQNLLQQGNSTPCPSVGSSRSSMKNETTGDVSLSSWLKPPPSCDDGDSHNLGAASCRKVNVGNTPGDRPIIGLVAAHWNDQEEISHVSPKWWDGNGIPNSTTKYKEDQKVRWHATPFEERLEKALSEETFVPQRKPITGAPIIFEETEGQDTASSQLQSINRPKSVVSF